MNKLFIITSWISLVTATALILLVTFWLTYPYKPAKIDSINTSVNQVKTGDSLSYQINYCKYMDLPATVIRAFIDGVIFTTNSITTNNLLGCHTNGSVIVVPQELNSGSYQLKTTWIYKVNPLREITVTAISNKFEVIGKNLDRQSDQEAE